MKRIFILIFLLTFTAFSNSLKPGKEDYFKLIKELRTLDNPMPVKRLGDWLSHNPEPGQTFYQFKRVVEKPITIKEKIIYLKPIGDFDTNQLLILEGVASYLSNFYQCKVLISERVSLNEIPRKAKRKHEGFLQLNTDYINYKILYPTLPNNAIAYMAITTFDLFPSKNWNFVFGQADQLNKVGVSSIARYNYPDTLNFKETLGRIIKTSAHEIGHMLGIEHCINASCLMNGSNDLEESDNQPQNMCSECVVKLSWRTQIDLIKRDSSLSNYFNQHGLIKERSFIDKRLHILKQFIK